MRIKRNDEFGDLGTAVYYKFQCYIPRDNRILPDINKFVSEKVLIHGTTKRFDGIDFAEYDFNAVLEDQKFNNRDLISYLDKNTMDQVGDTINSLEKINSALFPTLSDRDKKNNIEYFGTLNLSAITLYLFNLDPSYYKIELYEDVIYSNNDLGNFIDSDYLDVAGVDHISPAVTIYLGPEENCLNNAEDMYHSSDPYAQITNRGKGLLYSPLEYSKLYGEIFSGKSVWLALSSDKNIREINLSYNAWLKSEDANIFKHKFNLRNDEFYSFIKNPSCFKKDDLSGYIDTRSGKLLGNQLYLPSGSSNTPCPILSRKIKNMSVDQFGNDGSNYSIYKTFKTYSSGDIVKYGNRYFKSNANMNNNVPGEDNTWEEVIRNYNPSIEYDLGERVLHCEDIYKAIRKGNRGHCPDFSKYWIKESALEENYTTRIAVTMNVSGGGILSPSKFITILDPESPENVLFHLTENVGYSLDTIKGLSSAGVELCTLEKDTDFVISDPLDGVDNYKLVTILKAGWKKVLDSGASKILFSLKEKLVSIKTNASIYFYSGSKVTETNDFIVCGLDETLTMNSKYAVVLSKIVKNKVSYTSELDSLLKLIKVGDDLEFYFTFVDTVSDISLDVGKFLDSCSMTLGAGTSDSKTVPLDITNTEYLEIGSLRYKTLKVSIDSLQYDSILFNIAASTFLNATIVEYDEFEVSDVVKTVSYGGDLVLQFYGTYKDNLDKVVLDFSDESFEIVRTDSGNTWKASTSITKYAMSGMLVRVGTMYTLQLIRLKKDVKIKILKK